jgi:hypothetical protein
MRSEITYVVGSIRQHRTFAIGWFAFLCGSCVGARWWVEALAWAFLLALVIMDGRRDAK